MTDRTIEYVPVRDLVDSPTNPKTHDDEGIIRSIDRLGMIDLIVLDERTGTIISGHGRRGALEMLEATGQEPPEGIVVDDQGRWCVPVVRGWASGTDDDRDAALVAVNHLTTLGGWSDSLGELLDSLSEDLLPITGFTPDDVADFLAVLGGTPNLDDLERQFGDPDPADLWPVLRFKVDPTVRDRYLKLVDGMAGSDADLFAHIVTLAERKIPAKKTTARKAST